VLVRHALPQRAASDHHVAGLEPADAGRGGGVFREYVFSDSRRGLLTFTSIFARDYPTLMAITMLTAVSDRCSEICLPSAYAIAVPDTVRLMRQFRRFCANDRPRRRPYSSRSSCSRAAGTADRSDAPDVISHPLLGLPQPRRCALVRNRSPRTR